MFDEEEDAESEEGGPTPAGFVRSALIFYGIMGCGALLWRMSSPG